MYKLNNNDDKANTFVGSFSAIVNLDYGHVVSITWDDDCGECSDSLCVDGKFCGISYSDSAISNNCTNKCDLIVNIYIFYCIHPLII